ATRVDDQPLSGYQVEVEEVPTAVQPDGAFPFQALKEEAFAAASDTHAELLRERALDLDVTVVAEVCVLLADDLAVELVLPDRAGERPGDPDGAGPVGPIEREEEAVTCHELPL